MLVVCDGFQVENFGKRVAGGVTTFAHGVVDRLEISIVAKLAPIFAGAAVVFFGAAAVKHLQKRNRKAQTSPTIGEVFVALLAALLTRFNVFRRKPRMTPGRAALLASCKLHVW